MLGGAYYSRHHQRVIPEELRRKHLELLGTSKSENRGLPQGFQPNRSSSARWICIWIHLVDFNFDLRIIIKDFIKVIARINSIACSGRPSWSFHHFSLRETVLAWGRRDLESPTRELLVRGAWRNMDRRSTGHQKSIESLVAKAFERIWNPLNSFDSIWFQGFVKLLMYGR